MASNPSTLFTISVFLLLFFSQSLADFVSSSLIPSSPLDPICKITPDPDFCKANLAHDIPAATIYDYGRISVHKSLLEATKFQSLVDYYRKLPSRSSLTTIRALEDCSILAGMNIDSLSHASEIVNSTRTLHSLQADDLHTLLSAILTNQQTCLDGLQEIASASSILQALLAPLLNGAKLYSVSLALVINGWFSQSKNGRWLTERKHVFSSNGDHHNDHLPLRMSRRDRKIYESVTGRRLHQQENDEQYEDSVTVSQMVVVNPNGSADFTTISDAVAAAPNSTSNSSNGYFLIYVAAGDYREYVTIPKKKQNLMMIGAGKGLTVISGNRNNVDGWTTFNSATFAAVGQGFVAVNITFRNTAGATKHQAVAVRNGADMSTFYRCSFEGYQDTLYAHSLRQFYRDCDIYGTIDFIFGNSAAVFQNCNMYPRRPLDNQFNAITAQGRTDPNQNTGISIHNCTIRAAHDLAYSGNATQTYLGRPWKEYSRTVYMQSFMDSFIDPAGWIEWSGDFAINTTYYAEFHNSGPGSNTSSRVTWPGYHVINEADADCFTVSNFIDADAWLPETGVPFDGDLLS